MLAIAENGDASHQTLTLYVTVPAAALIFLVATAAARGLGLGSFARAVALGLLFGAVSTAGLEVVRNIVFYEFEGVPQLAGRAAEDAFESYVLPELEQAPLERLCDFGSSLTRRGPDDEAKEAGP
jgi:hypothetical protein